MKTAPEESTNNVVEFSMRETGELDANTQEVTVENGALVAEKGTEDHHQRGTWGNKLEFFMAMLGSCVGLGTVWRFPYLCYSNGRGAFLFAYVVLVVLLGLPIFYLETAIGQFSNLGVLSVWKVAPLYKGVGIGAMITAVLITTYYNALIAQFLYYLVLSMNDPLPWATCAEWWGASECCQECSPKAVNCKPTRNVSANCNKTFLPSEEFYNNYVLKISDGIDNFGYPVWQLSLCLLVCWVLVALVVLKGASSFGKAAYFTALFPYVVLFSLLIQGLMLEGSGDGILQFIVPEWEKLLDPIVWVTAAGQVFYSLSTSFGQTMAMASYNDFRHPVLRDGTIIVFMTMFSAVLSGLVVFSILGFMAQQKGELLADVVTGGPGLVFKVYPEAIAKMGVSTLWSILFFLMMLTLGFGTQFSLVETIQVALQDEINHVKKLTKKETIIMRISVAVTLFLLGLPLTFQGGMFLLSLIDQSSGTFSLLFIAFAECIVITWVYGWKRFAEDIRIMSGKFPLKYFIICWSIILPIVLFVLLVANFVLYTEPEYEGYRYPGWALGLGILMMILPIAAIPAWMLYHHCYVNKGWILMREASRPTTDWGPHRKEDREIYLNELPEKFRVFQSPESMVKNYVDAMSPILSTTTTAFTPIEDSEEVAEAVPEADANTSKAVKSFASVGGRGQVNSAIELEDAV